MLMEYAPVGIALVDMEGIIRDLNPRGVEMLGAPDKQACIGMDALSRPPIKQFGLDEKLRRAMEGEFQNTETFYESSFGAQLHMRVNMAPLWDDGGKQIGVLAAIADMSTQRESEERYQLLFSQMLDGYALHEIILDENNRPVDYRFLEVNPAFEKLTGLNASEIIGRTVLEVLPNTEQIWIDNYGWVAMTGSPIYFENYSQALGRHYEVTSYSPKKGQFATVFHDITERKRMEQALEKQHAFLRQIIDANPNFIYTRDYTGRFTLANQALVEAMGVSSSAELIGKTDYEFYDEKAHDRVASFLAEDQQVMRTAQEMFLEDSKNTFPDGKTRILQVHKLPVVGEDGKADEILGVLVDITPLKRQVDRLAALREIDWSITMHGDATATLRIVADLIRRNLEIDAVAVYLLDDDVLRLQVARGFRSNLPDEAPAHLGCCVQEGRRMAMANLEDSPNSFDADWLAEEGFKACFGVPLRIEGKTIGGVAAFDRRRQRRDKDWQEFLETICNQAAIAVDNANMLDDLRRANTRLRETYRATVDALGYSLELRDRETEGHSRRVTSLAMKLSRRMGITDDADLDAIYCGAALHDIGKMGVPDNILLKPGPLTPDERAEIRRHTVYGYDLLAKIPFLARFHNTMHVVLYHHERWDGGGYPVELIGEEIPLPARIFAVVDTWDSLRHERPYKLPWPDRDALAYIRQQAGTQFDPQVVDTFLNVVKEAD